MTKTRIEAFSDGVLAIAITLLVLNLKTDRPVLFLNLLLLMGIVFIPFPTALIAEHIRAGDARSATLAYGCTGVRLAIFFNALWHYAISNTFFGKEPAR